MENVIYAYLSQDLGLWKDAYYKFAVEFNMYFAEPIPLNDAKLSNRIVWVW